MNREEGNIRLVKIDPQNFDEMINLQVNEIQKEFVAPNIYSLAEAYANLSAGKYAQPFGIYDGEIPVGFLMIGYDCFENEDDLLKYPIIKDNYMIWRFMIDKNCQKKGYGTAAMKLALDFIRTWPCGKAEYCWLSYEPENVIARKLYQSFGFVEESKIPEDWDEIPAVLKL